ncbi:HEPN domain-containing protein [Burkholderia cenocepacia]|uniref:RiboL-PSP-HEPN domain-containing protein n=1 Tax=Burkholderia cenocepacia TaxID=95486 RepID=A0ABD4US01_9BURK|nr:HEPN domain-containing protein [Burkholderia cenocepacia]MCW3700998.1 hypothetical protein [Burkholderia cenocepacia]MCW3708890.1 hypothetical protein [Burkholderia cenocepacia]MCW3716892.1 hypothetical protein [Burkholderia cenocepacia]MCW3724888.1 hypothetical protein [Burkholderia cenocepacia]MCW3732894.1 hypothetical protein [Burkholderia cenocepacia]
MSRIQAEAPHALRDKAVFDQHNTIQLGAVVLLSGFLESFLRSACESYFAELASKGFGMRSLGDEYLKVHLREGAGHLADLVKRESKRKNSLSDSSAFVRRLVAPISDATKSPVWEAFARTQGNPSAEVVKSILQGLDIKGGFSALDTAIGNKYSAATMAQLLNNLNDLRNECAHTGTTTNVPQPSTINDLVQFTRLLALAICRLLDRKVTELTSP